ncbi:MAG: enoyl-CoA hydratase [Lautropia sp.]
MNELRIDRSADGIACVTLDNPDARNALTLAVRERLGELFDGFSSDPSVRCVVITGGPRIFAAGADLRDMVERRPIELMLRRTEAAWRKIGGCAKPVIAAVNGYAWGGGCELAMHADIIVAGEQSSFAQPEVRVGIMPGAGGTQRLTRAVGKFQAMRMLLTGCAVSGREALAMGLVSEVVADAAVLPRALELAAQIAALPPLAVAQIKEVVLAGQDASLDAALMLERKAGQLLFDSADQKEGMRAFLEKRKPEFRGR